MKLLAEGSTHIPLIARMTPYLLGYHALTIYADQKGSEPSTPDGQGQNNENKIV